MILVCSFHKNALKMWGKLEYKNRCPIQVPDIVKMNIISFINDAMRKFVIFYYKMQDRNQRIKDQMMNNFKTNLESNKDVKKIDKLRTSCELFQI